MSIIKRTDNGAETWRESSLRERFVKTAQPTTQLPCGPHSAQRARRLGSRAARRRMGSAAAVHSASAARSPALSVWPLCPIPLSRARCLFVFSLLRASFQQLFTSSPSQLVSRCPSLWPPACLPRSICPRGLAAGPYGRPCTATCARPSTPKSRPAFHTQTHTGRGEGRRSVREREATGAQKVRLLLRAYPEPQELIADRVRGPKVAFHPRLLALHQLVEDPLVAWLAVHIRRRGWAVGTRAAGAFWAGSIRRAARVSRAVVVVPPRRRPLRVAIASAAVVVPSVVIPRRRRPSVVVTRRWWAAVIVPVVVAAVAIALVVSRRRRALVVPARAKKKSRQRD